MPNLSNNLFEQIVSSSFCCFYCCFSFFELEPLDLLLALLLLLCSNLVLLLSSPHLLIIFKTVLVILVLFLSLSLSRVEMHSYVLLIRVMKVGEDTVIYKPDYSNSQSGEFKKLARLTSEEIDKAYGLTEIKENYIGADVMGIARNIDDEEGVLVNITLHVTGDESVSEDLLRDELMKSLEESEALPTPAMITAEFEDLMDFDECSDPKYHDCSAAAVCINQPGSYTCQCKGIFSDLDPQLPGRICAAEVKACDQCNGRGDCVRDEGGEVTTCKCQRMYLGRYCEINGIRESYIFSHWLDQLTDDSA